MLQIPHSLYRVGVIPHGRAKACEIRHSAPSNGIVQYPSPHPTDQQRESIGRAAAKLNEFREGWLDPSGASDDDLKLRTLTNLYNEPPTWLRDAHADLDRAVLAAYGWPTDSADDEIVERLLKLNLARAGGSEGVR